VKNRDICRRKKHIYMEETKQQFEAVKEAARQMTVVTEKSAKILGDIADALVSNTKRIVEANALDLSRMDKANPNYDRLMLTEERIAGIAADTRKVASLPTPIGELMENRKLPNGLKLSKVRVPLGVVGVIYEARPNVTVDVVALCLRSGNAAVLKGGSDARESNTVLVDIMKEVLCANDVNPDVIQLLPHNHEAAADLMSAVGYIDVLIPRGSQKLIRSVREQAKVPTIETGAGVVHTYFDASGALKIGRDVITNAKTRRVSVCNALDCAIIHSSRLSDLPELLSICGEKGVEVFADERAYTVLDGKYAAPLHHAQPEDFGREFLSMKMAVKTVDSLDEALDHIYTYGLKHSEAIITEDANAAARFLNEVDAACVYVNTSTAFTDGAQFGLGAEIGISTQKLHARGPMALRELTSYKWQVVGNGQTRS
jgi:glutamate-5-semialdehyde dehydrogenase